MLQAYSVLACIIYIDDITRLCGNSIIFSASYCNKDRGGTVKLEGPLVAYTMHVERFGQYTVEGPNEQSICRIIENNSGNYDTQLEKPPEGSCNTWHAERPDGCSYWKLTPQSSVNSYNRRIYIDRVPNSCAWRIYMTANYPEEKVTQSITTVNFALFTIMYSKSCKSKYWV